MSAQKSAGETLNALFFKKAPPEFYLNAMLKFQNDLLM